jgi:hypothetical protein
MPTEEERYPNMAAERAWDRAQHVRRGMAMGLTKKEAQRHANADLNDATEPEPSKMLRRRLPRKK